MTELIEDEMSGVNLRNRKGSKLRFKMYLTKTMCETPIEVLDMSVRSNNCLRRANIKTVGDIADAIANGIDLANIRNCGAKSRREIMERMMLFQYYSLPEKQRGAYLREVVDLNCHNN